MVTVTQLNLIEQNSEVVVFRAPASLVSCLEDLSKKSNTTKSELIRRGISRIINDYNC